MNPEQLKRERRASTLVGAAVVFLLACVLASFAIMRCADQTARIDGYMTLLSDCLKSAPGEGEAYRLARKASHEILHQSNATELLKRVEQDVALLTLASHKQAYAVVSIRDMSDTQALVRLSWHDTPEIEGLVQFPNYFVIEAVAVSASEIISLDVRVPGTAKLPATNPYARLERGRTYRVEIPAALFRVSHQAIGSVTGASPEVFERLLTVGKFQLR